MKSSHLSLTQLISCLAVLLLAQSIAGQAIYCGNGSDFAGGPIIPDENERWEIFCNEAPEDHNITQGAAPGFRAICRDCAPLVHGPTRAHTGGSDLCTSYGKKLVIEFEQPVADLRIGIAGAYTITDNRGMSFQLNPFFDEAFFPGGGITKVTVTDPRIFDLPYAHGAWQIWIAGTSWVWDSSYQECNCNRPTFTRPAPQGVFSPDWSGNGIEDWRMDVEISDDDGLVFKNIRLENRYMAEKISVPYYLLETNSISPTQRGELKPEGLEPSMASRLVNFNSWNDDEKLVVEATYVIGKIPEGSTSCLVIVQKYEFHKSKPGDKCEPLASLPCARWYPNISYRLVGPPTELRSITIPQRNHFRVNGFEANSIGLFRDCAIPIFPCVLSGGVLFSDKINPLTHEYEATVIRAGKDAKEFDNFHQTFLNSVDEPLVNPGCPECVHLHWRWGWANGKAFGSGNPLITEGSNQDVEIAAVRFRSSEEDPVNYKDLLFYPEPIRSFGYLDGSNYQHKPEDVVFWYSSTGRKQFDTFFPTKGGFFNPSYQGATAPISEGPPQLSLTASEKRKADHISTSLLSEDHPESITFADLYEDGTTTYSSVDPATLGTLPSGYAVYNSAAYDVVTAATVSGPHVVTFTVPSVPDQTAFDSLRILHVEPDSFDPEILRLKDETILSPESPAPDFANRKISAKVDGVGTFVLATYTPQPPNTDLANLSVSVSDAPDAIVASNNLTYTVNVTNNGPQAASEVMLKDNLAPEAKFVSVNASQGTCREVDGSVLCSLNSLAANSAATITIVVTPHDAGSSFPPGGKALYNVALVKANEGDTNLVDNSFIESTTVMPDPNLAPTIDLTSPTDGTVLVTPANLTLSATAADAGGSVSEVSFYDNENLLGTGTLTGTNQYDFSWNNISLGSHIVTAVATDNLGKQRASDPVMLLVNGSALVSITSPANWTAFNRPANIAITANASLSGGTINQVDFYEDGVLLGTGTPSGGGQYGFTRNAASAGQRVFTAVVTDTAGVTTTSAPITVTVNDPPVVSLLGPANGAVFTASNITIRANASDWDGGIAQVGFYANGSLIGTSFSHGVNLFDFVWSNPPPGNYSLTAVATDNHWATKTSAPINIRVNASPTGSIVAPSSGAQFTAPAIITLIANATDADGTISKVDFFASGYRVGSGTPIGGNQFQFVWNNVGIGTYGFTASVTDNDGAKTALGGPLVTVSSPVLLVTGSTTLNPSDAAIKTRLENLGYTVTVKDGASSTTADANGKAVVVVSSTVTPASVGTKFRTVTVPVVLWESGLFVNMGMTPSGNQNSGTTSNQTQVKIINASHPLAATLTGNVTVSASNAMNWGKPNANGISVATLVGDTTKSVIFGYQTGAVMPGLTTPARRVGLFMSDNTAVSFTASGGNLFDAAIKWATGGATITGSYAGLSPGSVNLTDVGLVYWLHWGLLSPPLADRKNLLNPLINGYTTLGTSSVSAYADNLISYNWSDGTPTLSTSGTTTGVFVNNTPGNGFEINVPANTNLKTLKFYVGVWFAQGRLEAGFTDGSAPAYVDTTIGATPGRSNGVYTIQFKSAAPEQTLRIRYTIQTNHFAPYGNVTLESATLQ